MKGELELLNISKKTGLSVTLLKEMIKVISKYTGVEKAVIFGSRGRGDFKKTSDIDICIFGNKVTHVELNILEFDLGELNTPINFDVVSFKSITKEELKENILKDGVEIYDKKRLLQRFEDFENAFRRLKEAFDINIENDIIIDGIMQRFEFTFELAWKLIKDYLAYEGIVIIGKK